MSLDQPEIIPAAPSISIPAQAQPTGAPPVVSASAPVAFLADRSRVVHVGAAAVMVLGTMLPWVSVLFFKMSGMDYDSGAPFWCALLALAAIATEAKIPWRWLYRAVTILLPIYVGSAAIYVLVRASSVAPVKNEFFDIAVHPGPGVFITAAGAITCLVLTGRKVVRERGAI